MPLGEKKKKVQEKIPTNIEEPFILAGRYEVDNRNIGKGVSSIVMSAIDL